MRTRKLSERWIPINCPLMLLCLNHSTDGEIAACCACKCSDCMLTCSSHSEGHLKLNLNL